MQNYYHNLNLGLKEKLIGKNIYLLRVISTKPKCKSFSLPKVSRSE